jgi:hypothetical protein
VKEAGLDFPITPDLAYVYGERKWHSYVTYVRASEAAAVEMNRMASPGAGSGLVRSVQLESVGLPQSAPATQSPEVVDLIAKLATSSSAAFTNLDVRLRALEDRYQAANAVTG